MAEVHSTVEYRDLATLGFPGYRIGSDGSVWTCWRRANLGYLMGTAVTPDGPWRTRKSRPSKRTGYLEISLASSTGKWRTSLVHRLVLAAFVGPCPEGMECRHLNGIRADCRLKNLAWGTKEQNRQDNHDMGSYRQGSGHPGAKLSEAGVRAIRNRYAGGGITRRQLAREHGVAFGTITDILGRRSWRHLD